MKPLIVREAGLSLSGRAVLRDLSFALNAGEWSFLLGPPGAGKTTLLRLAAGDIAPTAGAVERSGAALFAHHATPLDDAQTSRAIVAAAAAGPDALLRAEELLGELGLATYLGHEPFRLSRGHRARLVLARGVAARPALLCLDDPYAPMDRRARQASSNVLARAAEQDGLAILMASNDPLDALRHADRILVLGGGPVATVVETIAHRPTPDADDDELASTELHARLWRALEG